MLSLFLFFVLGLQIHAALGADLADMAASLVRKIPLRPSSAMTGSEFAEYASAMNGPEREQAILTQLIKGNIPDFLRNLRSVQLVRQIENGKRIVASVFVMPDYLAIGSDQDFLLIPMALETATKAALDFGFILPTGKIVDAIFQQSAFHFVPTPMAPGPQMRSTAYYLKHNQKIKEQRLALGMLPGNLVSGHKKDVVITNLLAHHLGRIAIYGWHRLSGIPIQPLSIVHGARYADYSHGIRLVSDTVLIDDQPRSIYDVLMDPRLANLLSDEGPIENVHQMMTSCFH